MQVVHALARRRVGVEDEPVAVVREAELASQPAAVWTSSPTTRVAPRRDLERARAYARAGSAARARAPAGDVLEGEHALVLEHELRRQLLRGDLAERQFGPACAPRLRAARQYTRRDEPASSLPERLLLGPGPCNVSARCSRRSAGRCSATSIPRSSRWSTRCRAGCARLLDDTAFALPLSGTGSAGMEACLVNLLEPGETAGRCERRLRRADGRGRAPRGRRVATVEAELGEPCRPTRLHGRDRRACDPGSSRSSTPRPRPASPARGRDRAQRPRRRRARRARLRHVARGHAPCARRWGIDAAYSGTQKCLSCPPGCRRCRSASARSSASSAHAAGAELVSRPLAARALLRREARLPPHRADHHDLRPRRRARPRARGRPARALRAARGRRQPSSTGLESLGFEPLVAAADRLPMLTSVVPPVAGEAALRRRGCSTSSGSRSAAASASSRAGSGASD